MELEGKRDRQHRKMVENKENKEKNEREKETERKGVWKKEG